MMARPFGLGPVFKTLCLLAMVTGASLSFAQSPAPAKLVVKKAGKGAGKLREESDVADRLANRVQLTTDGHGAYLQAVVGAFGIDVDYAQLVKHYGESGNAAGPER